MTSQSSPPQSAIAIRNIYVMMAYAFKSIRSSAISRVEREQFENLHDLFAEILIHGAGAQVKRGLNRDYVQFQEQLSAPRGRISMSGSIAAMSMTRHQLMCEFDEYTVDTPHNRALKSVLVLLMRHGNVAARRREKLRRLLPYFEDVQLLSPRDIRWDALTYHRAVASYRMLLGTCELVVRGLLPSTSKGTTQLTEWVSTEAMSALFERFLREYFAFHHPGLRPAARIVEWDTDREVGQGGHLLPKMRTDITLSSGTTTLVVDAKFYESPLQQGQWGKHTIHSGNLYQLLAYVQNMAAQTDGEVSGMLLYARTTAPVQPAMDLTILGHHILVETVDLQQSWATISAQLDAIAGILEV